MDACTPQNKINVILLPGLDGTGLLFSEFISLVPSWANPVVISYASDVVKNHEGLANEVLSQIDQSRPFLLLGESFSGPAAFPVASKCQDNLLGIVLCGSFISSPRPLFSKLLHPALLTQLFSLGLPAFVVRHYLGGWDASTQLVKDIQTAVHKVAPKVLATRLMMVGKVDVTKDARACPCPMIYVLGTQDRLVSRKSLQTIQTKNPNVITVEVNAPHLIAQTNPHEVWETIGQIAALAYSKIH